MTKLPSVLRKDIIIEAIFEVRFEPNLPNEAIFGAIYPIVNKKFKDMQHIPLPILQVPEVVRNSDIQFKYQAFNRLQKDGFSISIGPRVVSFSVIKPYIGWSKWKPSILNILNEISDGNIIKIIEGTGLRYLNFIEKDIYPFINAEVKIINTTVKPISTSIRTEIAEGDYIKILQLANNASINERGQNKSGSLIDIDIVRNKKLSNSDFGINIETILNKSHGMAKQLFFDILKENFINELEPVYGEISNE